MGSVTVIIVLAMLVFGGPLLALLFDRQDKKHELEKMKIRAGREKNDE